MFLHIGGSQIVFGDELIGIFNYKLADNKTNQNLFSTTSSDKLSNGGESEKPKSVILTDYNVYLSPISPLTLYRRHVSSLNSEMLNNKHRTAVTG